MGLHSTSSRYGVGAQVFHWLTVVLVLAAYVLSKGDGYSLYSAAADGIRRFMRRLGCSSSLSSCCGCYGG